MSKPCCALLLGGLLMVSAADAAEPFVIASFNQAALARHAPLPVPQTPGAAAGVQVVADWTTENVIDMKGNETLLLDGEALRLALRVAAARGPWRWTAELPLLSSGGGVLDAPIENWHGWFGLPNAGRDTLPRDDYRYRYQRGADTPLDLARGDSGLGDLRLGAGYCGATRCARTMLQLPSGDADDLQGGGLGVAAWIEQAYRLGPDGRWSGVIAAGGSALRADGPLEAQQREALGFGWASLGYAVTERWALGAQFTLHTPLYKDSELDALRQTGGQLAVALSYDSGSAGIWSLGFQEDPIVESSPDFSIHLAWRSH